VHIQREFHNTVTWIDIDKNIYNETGTTRYTLDICRIPIFAREKRSSVEHIMTEKKGAIGFGTDKK
jgi:hypothetical protein